MASSRTPRAAIGKRSAFRNPRGCRGHRGQRDQSLHRAPATRPLRRRAREPGRGARSAQPPVQQCKAGRVSLRQALLDLDEKNLAGADDWMAKATGHCAERCPAGAAIHNVRAQLALQAGRTDAAFLAARSAHDASRASGDQAEQANALRLLGIVGLKNGDAASARQHLEQALAIDRELARRARSRSTCSPSARRRWAVIAKARGPTTLARSPSARPTATLPSRPRLARSSRSSTRSVILKYFRLVDAGLSS